MSRSAHRFMRALRPVLLAPIYRIACGQTSSVNSGVPIWSADAHYSGDTSPASVTQQINTSGVAHAAPMSIYQNERWANGPLTYTFNGLVPNTSYTFRLHFAEVYYSASGQRVMNIATNGVQRIGGFDIYSSAGGAGKAVAIEAPGISDNQGILNLTLTPTSAGNDPKICGIELIGRVVYDDTPINLVASAGATYVNLSWEAPLFPTGPITGYNVFQNGVKLNTSPLSTTTYRPGKDSSPLATETQYTFTVKPVINGTESTKSASRTVTTTQAHLIFTAGKRVKIMAIGDSTTEAINGSTGGLCPGYRGPLWTRLNAAGYLSEAVGPNLDTAKGVPIVDSYHDRHAGNSGWELRRMRDNVIQWMNQPGQMPDVALIVGGNNSMEHPPMATPQQAANEMRGLVSNIYSVNPNAVVFISTDTPNAPAASSNLVQYVALVPGIVDEFRAMGRKAFFVDSFSIVPQNYSALPDGAHPTLYWYDKLAENWFNEITQADIGQEYP